MSIFGDLDQSEIDEIKPAKFGVDLGPQKLMITSAVCAFSKKGNWGMTVIWSDEDGGSLRQYVSLPSPTQDERKLNLTKRYLAKFLTDIEIPRNQWGDLEPDEEGEVEMLIGIEANGTVIEEPAKPWTDENGVVQPGRPNQIFRNISRAKSGPMTRSEPRVANDEDFGI